MQIDDLAEEVQAIITESVFTSRWSLVQGYWEVGKAIRSFEKGEVTKLVQDLALKINHRERTLWYAVQFYDKFPILDEVPEGKNISWNKIITKYLPDNPKPQVEKDYECPNCHFKGKVGDFK